MKSLSYLLSLTMLMMVSVQAAAQSVSGNDPQSHTLIAKVVQNDEDPAHLMKVEFPSQTHEHAPKASLSLGRFHLDLEGVVDYKGTRVVIAELQAPILIDHRCVLRVERKCMSSGTTGEAKKSLILYEGINDIYFAGYRLSIEIPKHN